MGHDVELPMIDEPAVPRRRRDKKPGCAGARYWIGYAVAHGIVAFLALIMYVLRSDMVRAPVPAWLAHVALVLAFWPVTVFVVVLLFGCMTTVAADDAAKVAVAMWQWLWDTSLPAAARAPGTHAPADPTRAVPLM